MSLTSLTHMSCDSQRQYRAVYHWFCATYKGDMTHTADMQRFIDDHPDSVMRCGLRGRILRSIIGRYLDPPPSGPPIHLTQKKRPKRTNPCDKTKLIHWLSFVPSYLHPTICEGMNSPVHTDFHWMQWTHDYVLAIGCHALRRNLIKSYVAYVHRILRPLCPEGTKSEFLKYGRSHIVTAMLTAGFVRFFSQPNPATNQHADTQQRRPASVSHRGEPLPGPGGFSERRLVGRTLQHSSTGSDRECHDNGRWLAPDSIIARCGGTGSFYTSGGGCHPQGFREQRERLCVASHHDRNGSPAPRHQLVDRGRRIRHGGP